ncbi:hypothetical protein [Streptosporangium sp. NPDC000396]|uniref:hypothetical protein n=1 Tax=Streptosporangium sp. NPDC000396 TaxID=3366185 RepID=UPI0036CFC2BB
MLFQEINQLITYDERQRMVPGDRDRLTALVDSARAQAPTDYTTLRALGVGLLVLGEYGDAIDHLNRALDLADTSGRRIAASINLADAYRYALHLGDEVRVVGGLPGGDGLPGHPARAQDPRTP